MRTPWGRSHPHPDDWCQVPGCSRKATREYHVLYECGGEDGGGENLVRVCATHLLILRRGWVRVRGRAPGQLRWELGVRKGRPPLQVFEPPARRGPT